MEDFIFHGSVELADIFNFRQRHYDWKMWCSVSWTTCMYRCGKRISRPVEEFRGVRKSCAKNDY